MLCIFYLNSDVFTLGWENEEVNDNNNNNKFIYTLDSEVRLLSVVFTGNDSIQSINTYSNKTRCKIKKTAIH